MPFHDLSVSVLALSGILGLIWLGQRLLQRGGRLLPAMSRTGAGRLRLIQSLAVDPRRRVLLLDCDGTEFLVLIGGGTDLLLERRPSGTVT